MGEISPNLVTLVIGKVKILGKIYNNLHIEV